MLWGRYLWRINEWPFGIKRWAKMKLWQYSFAPIFSIGEVLFKLLTHVGDEASEDLQVYTTRIHRISFKMLIATLTYDPLQQYLCSKIDCTISTSISASSYCHSDNLSRLVLGISPYFTQPTLGQNVTYSFPRPPLICYSCGRERHIVRNCFNSHSVNFI